MEFFQKQENPDFFEWIKNSQSTAKNVTHHSQFFKKQQYIAIPPDYTVINIENDKFNQSRRPYKTQNETHYYWICNQRPQCSASFISIKRNNVNYPPWAKYGYIDASHSISHTHEPKWTLPHGIREWSVNQMILLMSLDSRNKPRATINQFILDHPMEALEFKNINNYTRRLYQAVPDLHGVYPKSIEDIDEMCMNSNYSLTYHSYILKQQTLSTKFNKTNQSFHINQTLDAAEIDNNKALFAEAVFKRNHQVISLENQHKLDQMYLGMSLF